MKKKSIGRIGMLLSVLLFFTVVCFSVMKVEAAEIMATVHGTVLSGTTSDLIKLNANGVNMLIKVDSQTDMSDCKVLVPGFNIGVSVYRGDDAYLHAAKITTDLQTDGVILDSS